MEYNIAHVGAFDIENYGDLLFPDVVEKQLNKRMKINKIYYFAPNECMMPNTNRRVYSLLDLESMVSNGKINAIIIGGGDFVHLKKVHMYMPHIKEDWMVYDVLYMWVIPSLIAKKYNIPLMWNAPGVPIEFNENEKRIVKLLCEYSTYISVRDKEAKKVLSSCVLEDRIHVVPDSVLSISKLYSKEYLKPVFDQMNLSIQPNKYILFQGNVAISDSDLKICADTLKRMKDETGFDVVLQPIGFALGDEEVLKKIYTFYPDDFILCTHHTQYEILSLVANAYLYIGTSLHGCITSTSYGVKNITYNLNHYNKTDGFNDLMQQKQNVVYEAKSIYDVYKSIKPVDIDVLEERIKEIEYHFDIIVKGIQEFNQQKIILDVNDTAEYIFNSCEIEMNYLKTLEHEKQLENEVQKLIDLKVYFEKKNEELMNSTSWKLTKPFRKISRVIHSVKK